MSANGNTSPKPNRMLMTNHAEKEATPVNSRSGTVTMVLTSSKANSMPAKGAPKAAVSPATLPAMRKRGAWLGSSPVSR